MPRPKQYPLNDYIKAVEKLAALKNLRMVVSQGSSGSAIRFEVFVDNDQVPIEIWTIHTIHSKKREVWSKEDYRKPDRCLGARAGEFMEILESL